MHKTLATSILLGFLGMTACGDIGLSAGPTGTPDGTTGATTTAATTGSTTSGTTTSGTTTSGTTTSGTTTSGSTTSGTTTSGTTGSTTSGTTTSQASTCTSTPETYANFGMTFMQTNCTTCHGVGGNSPDLTTLANITAAQSSVTSQITQGSMPLGSTLSAGDKTNVLAWLACMPLP